MTNSSDIQVPPFVSRWYNQLKPLALKEAVPDPAQAGIFSIDVTVGFLSEGNLASERVGRIAQPVSRVFSDAYQHGIRTFVLLQDAHDPQTPEFAAFPPHSVQGSAETDTIPELRQLTFSNIFTIMEKNSLHPSLGTEFDSWLDEHGHRRRTLVLGDCADLCVYQLAIYLRLRANAFNLQDYEVIVPTNAVETFDVPEDKARETGALAHPAEFFHQVFLYHMALNGVKVVRELT